MKSFKGDLLLELTVTYITQCTSEPGGDANSDDHDVDYDHDDDDQDVDHDDHDHDDDSQLSRV